MKRTAARFLAALLLLSALLPSTLVPGQTGAGVASAAQAAAQTALTPPEISPQERIWPDEMIYFIMIDRFNNGETSNDGAANPSDPRAWHGGDLQGIIDKLDYIKSLGFSALWITPHVKNTGRDYHGYGAVDFFDTDSHFGTVAKTKEFVDKAHAKGLKVIFDIVVNHTGPQHPLVQEKPQWFNPQMEITNWNDDRQVQDGWIFNLPDFNQSLPEVRDYILQYSRFWIEQTGVDGFRLDTVKHVPKEFFTWYGAELQKVKPGFWLIGEVWHNAPYRLADYQKAGVQAMLDFPVSETAKKVFAQDASMSGLATMVSQVGRTMPDPWQMGAFLDNHDVTRFMTEAKQDDPEARLKLGLTFLFSQRSIPIMYYGTEIAMPGKNDPYNRDDFPWGKEQGHPVVELVKQLTTIRSDTLALRRGTVENLSAGSTHYAFARVAGESKAVVVLNNHAANPYREAVDVKAAGLHEGAVLKDALTGRTVTVKGGTIIPDVAPRSGAIYVAQVGGSARGASGFLAVGLGAVAVVGLIFLVVRRRRRA